MEVNQEGIIPDVIIKVVDTDQKLVELICKVRGLDPVDVKSMLRYNVVSFPQIQVLANCSPSYLQQITDGSKIRKGKPYFGLNICYPFPLPGKKPFKFIYRNPKFHKWLEQKIKEDVKRLKNQSRKSEKATAE